MTVTLNWDTFKKNNKLTGARVVYVANGQRKITKLTLLSKTRLAVLYIIADPKPTEAEFLVMYPGSWEIDNIVS